MAAPNFTGVHHLKIPVTDVEASASWFERAFGARRVKRFDHREKDGTLFAAMMMMPGIGSPVELRHASKAAKAVAGYDPFTFGVKDKAALDRWVEHFDKNGVKHSPVVTGYIGHVIGVDTPDGLAIRIYTDPEGGFEHVVFHPEQADIDAPSLSTPLMERS